MRNASEKILPEALPLFTRGCFHSSVLLASRTEVGILLAITMQMLAVGASGAI